MNKISINISSWHQRIFSKIFPKALALISLVGLISCDGSSIENVVKSKSTSEFQATDFAGNTIALALPATKIIALAPHIVENVFTAGAGQQLVGVVSYSNYPEQAKSLPIVGAYSKINFEKIIQLNPDLIIAWESGNSEANIERLKELGFNVYLDQPNTLGDIAESIRDIGALSGHLDIAEMAATDFDVKIESVRNRMQAKEAVSVFYQVWNSPLQTINGNHFISDAIELCGGVNIYASELVTAPIINIESILQRDPAAIIASGMSESRPDWLDDWLQWPTLTAVKNDHLFFVEPDHIQRHTVRLLLGIDAVCEQLDIVRSHRLQSN